MAHSHVEECVSQGRDPKLELKLKKLKALEKAAKEAEKTAAVPEKENRSSNAWIGSLWGQASTAKGAPVSALAQATAAKQASPTAKAEPSAKAEASAAKAAPPAAKADPSPATAAADCSSGNATQGASIFKAKCATCHTCNQDGPNKSGPNLFGVMGRQSGQANGFKYTPANKDSGVTWSNESMFEFLTNPKKFIKGTNMAFPGFKKEADRADVIAYLNTLK